MLYTQTSLTFQSSSVTDAGATQSKNIDKEQGFQFCRSAGVAQYTLLLTTGRQLRTI